MLQTYLNLLGPRQHSMTALIEMLPANPTIVETGCIRQENNWHGDGCSTLLWNEIIAERGGRAFSVDIDRDAVQLAQRLCPNVRVMHGGSIGFLAQLTFDSVDLLYLDAVDFGTSYADQLAAAIHCMHELTAAAHSRPRIVAVDDTVRIGRHFFGKGMIVADYMQKVGAEIVIADRCQCAWRL